MLADMTLKERCSDLNDVGSQAIHQGIIQFNKRSMREYIASRGYMVHSTVYLTNNFLNMIIEAQVLVNIDTQYFHGWDWGSVFYSFKWLNQIIVNQGANIVAIKDKWEVRYCFIIRKSHNFSLACINTKLITT